MFIVTHQHEACLVWGFQALSLTGIHASIYIMDSRFGIGKPTKRGEKEGGENELDETNVGAAFDAGEKDTNNPEEGRSSNRHEPV